MLRRRIRIDENRSLDTVSLWFGDLIAIAGVPDLK